MDFRSPRLRFLWGWRVRKLETMAPKTIPVPDSIWRSLEAMRADFLSKETVVARWEPLSVDVEVQNWARAVTASGALTAALSAVAAEDPELADQ